MSLIITKNVHYLKSSCCSSFLSCFLSLYFASWRLTLLVESCIISKTVRPDDKIVIAYMNLRKIVFSIGLCERSRTFLDRKWPEVIFLNRKWFFSTGSTFLERVMAKPSTESALDKEILCRYKAYWRLFWHFNSRILSRSYKTTNPHGRRKFVDGPWFREPFSRSFQAIN